MIPTRTLVVPAVRPLPLSALGLVVLLALPASAQVPFGGPDSYGYRFISSGSGLPNAPTFDFEDISSTGTYTNLRDDDELGLTTTLDFPFYGQSYNEFTVGNNGGIVVGTLGSNVPFSNSVLTGPSTPPRILPYHDDLFTFPQAAPHGVYTQEFTICPIITGGGGNGDCLIVQWNQLENNDAFGADQGTFQAVLYANGQILFQYLDVDFGNAAANNGASATVGLQGPGTGLTGPGQFLQHSFNTAGSVPNNYAVKFVPVPNECAADAANYRCVTSAAFGNPDRPTSAFTDISGTGTNLFINDDSEANVELAGWLFPFYTLSAMTLRVGNNGGIVVGTFGDVDPSNQELPSSLTSPRIYPHWDNVDDEQGTVFAQQFTSCPNTTVGAGDCLIVQWHNRPLVPGSPTEETVRFQAVLSETGRILFVYDDLDADAISGDYASSATIGIQENSSVGNFVQYSFNAPVAVPTPPLTGSPALGASPYSILFGINVIPVELTSFTARADGDAAVLAWATASETNNAGFEVQLRAPGAADFTTAAFVEGHGTTTEAQRYEYAFRGLAAGTYSVRLRQVDFDGASEFTEAIEVTVGVPGTHALSSAYPNPFNPRASFTLAVAAQQDVTVELFDALGRGVQTLFSGTLEAGAVQRIEIDGASLPSGLYLYRATGTTFSATGRVTLLK